MHSGQSQLYHSLSNLDQGLDKSQRNMFHVHVVNYKSIRPGVAVPLSAGGH